MFIVSSKLGHVFLEDTPEKEQSRFDVRKYSFSQRTINKWTNYLLIVCMLPCRGPFKCYVTQWGVGGCQVSRKKALRRLTVQRY